MIDHFANDPDARRDVPAMIGAPGLSMAILAPFAGLLVDKFGRRRLLLICTMLYALFGAAPLVLENLDQIYISRLLLGVAEAGILTVVNTLFGDYWDDHGRKNWLFLQGLLGPFIAAFVSLIVGYTSKVQWDGVFFVYLVAIPIWAAMLIWMFEPKGEPHEDRAINSQKERKSFPIAGTAIVAALTFFSSMLYYVFIINGALAFKEVGVPEPERYGQYIFIPSLFILLGAVMFKILAHRSNILQLGTFLALMGIGLAGVGLAQTPLQMVGALIIQQTAAGMAIPTLIGWAQSKFDFGNRGRGMGIWTGAFFLGQSQSPRLVHILDAQLGSMQSAFLLSGAIGVLVGSFMLFSIPARRWGAFKA
jgi:MFS family permease